MKRRHFLEAGAAALGSVIIPAKVARAQNLKRAAVVIGVGKVQMLARLNAAANDARLMAEFLGAEGYDVRLLVDDHSDDAAVSVQDIKDEVHGLVRARNLHQLLIYFSGHGFIAGSSGEMWLLSASHEDTDAAVNQEATRRICQYSGIPNVVFISDACRSTLASNRFQAVEGSNIFPSGDNAQSNNIDHLFATLPGRSAIEVKMDGDVAEYRSIFTDAFLAAYLDPPPERVLNVDGVDVVPNRKLANFLRNETKRLARYHKIVRDVEPDIQVPSADDVFIGRAWHQDMISDPVPDWVAHLNRTASEPESQPTDETASLPAVDPPARPSEDATRKDAYLRAFRDIGAPLHSSERDVSQSSLDKKMSDLQLGVPRNDLLPQSNLDLNRRVFVPGFNPIYGIIGSIANIGPDGKFKDMGPAPAGIASYGMPFDEIVTSSQINVDKKPSAVEERALSHAGLWLEDDGGDALAIFPDGISVVVPIIRGYVTHIFRGDTDVDSVSFEPVPERQFLEEWERRELNQLRALVVHTTADGAFYFSGNEEERTALAENFANRIRQYKATDPTLGVLSAYAYSQAFLPRQIESVRTFMLDDLQVPVYDIELLNRPSRAEHERFVRIENAVPFCPMLRPGWDLLQINGVSIAPRLVEARPYLRSALWTSFDPPGTEILKTAIREGQL